MNFLISLIVIALTFIPLALLIALFVRTSGLVRRIEKLEAHLGLQPDVSPPSAPPPRSPATEPPRPPPTPPTKPIVASAADPHAQNKAQEELEALIGGRLLNRIGAFALVLGVAFFLKYAFDNNWITETMRVLTGIVMGSICLAGGYRTQKKGYAVFAQGLVGAGIAILYLSLYASFNYYHLIPQWLAFALMSGVTILTLLQAVYYNSLVVGILGWAGGFLTPFLLSTGESNETALFTYIALLSLGLLAITMRRESWYALEPLTLIALFIVYFAWFDQYYGPGDFTLTIFFLFVFWILFHAADFTRSLLNVTQFPELRNIVQSLHSLLTYSAVYVLIWDQSRSDLGSVTFLYGILYAASFLVLRSLRSPAKGIEIRYGITIAALVLGGTVLEFSGVAAIRLLAVEGLLLMGIGVQFQRWSLAGPALGLLAASLAGFVFSSGSLVFEPIASFSLLATSRALTGGILALSLGAATLAVARARDNSIASLRPFLGIVFFLVLFILLTAETNDFFRHEIHLLRTGQPGESIRDELSDILNLRQLSVSGVWLLYSILALVVGIIRNAKGPRFFAIGLFGLTILKIFIVDLAFLQTLYRVFSFMALGVILLSVSYAYQRYKAVLFPSEPHH
ncbi:MAG: DUF2339 domain-containing protein [Bacteroidota bacterium]